MYEIFMANSRVEKALNKYLQIRKDIKNKLERLKQNPRNLVPILYMEYWLENGVAGLVQT